MGSPESEVNRFTDESQHSVTLTHGFWILETEVFQEMYESLMSNNPSTFKGRLLPVNNIALSDCLEFIKRFEAELPSSCKVSLPTEAEWEYACRAGTLTPFHFGNELNGDKANCNGRYPYCALAAGKNIGGINPVASYPPNSWGLYDMHGNVSEWCLDYFSNYPQQKNVTDPAILYSGSDKIIRGGNWGSPAASCRSAFRSYCSPTSKGSCLGFRITLVNKN
jgi:formylglycine-generating enzyme required for sulfatase activity